MNTHRKRRVRLTAAITAAVAAAIGSLALGATTSAISPEAGQAIVEAVRVGAQPSIDSRHVRGDDDVTGSDSACSLAAALTARNTVGGGVTYR